MPEIICIGSASKDIFYPTGEGIIVDTPEDIEAQQKVMFEVGAKYQIEDRYEAPGGVAANCSQGLVRLGIDAACYGKIGSDQTGDWVLAELEKEGVDTSLIMRDAEAWTDLSAILVFTQNGDRTIFYNRDANERLVVEASKLSGATWLFVSALNGAWEKNLDAILEAMHAEGARLALNPGQHNLQSNVTKVLEAVAVADVLLLNKDEAITLSRAARPAAGYDDLESEVFLIQTLHGCGAKTIGLTDGKRGAWASDGTQVFFAEAGEKDRVTDTTGAGDAFGSGFFAALLKGHDVATALRWGVSNGGNVVRYYGAREGLLREEEVAVQAESRTVTIVQ